MRTVWMFIRVDLDRLPFSRVFAIFLVINDNGRGITTLVDWNIHVRIIIVDSVFSSPSEYRVNFSCILRYLEVNWTIERRRSYVLNLVPPKEIGNFQYWNIDTNLRWIWMRQYEYRLPMTFLLSMFHCRYYPCVIIYLPSFQFLFFSR